MKIEQLLNHYNKISDISKKYPYLSQSMEKIDYASTQINQEYRESFIDFISSLYRALSSLALKGQKSSNNSLQPYQVRTLHPTLNRRPKLK